MPQRIKKFGQDFDVYHGDEVASVWEGESPPPPMLIKPASGDDLSWTSFEGFWVEYALYPESIDAKSLLHELLSHIMCNQEGNWVLSPEEKLKLVWMLVDQPQVRIVDSPFSHDDDLPWAFTKQGFLHWYNKVFTFQADVTDANAAAQRLRSMGYQIELNI